jgi:hypothetical protein
MEFFFYIGQGTDWKSLQLYSSHLARNLNTNYYRLKRYKWPDYSLSIRPLLRMIWIRFKNRWKQTPKRYYITFRKAAEIQEDQRQDVRLNTELTRGTFDWTQNWPEGRSIEYRTDQRDVRLNTELTRGTFHWTQNWPEGLTLKQKTKKVF